MSGAKKKLTIGRVDTTQPNKMVWPEFSAMLNPASYSRTSAVVHTEPEVTKKNGGEDPKLYAKNADTIDFDELLFDGTGVVDTGLGVGDVDAHISQLRKVLMDPASDGNVLNAVVEIAWGTLVFRGRITLMNVKYTLFDASGKPLRARVKLSFVAYDQTKVRLNGGSWMPQTRQIRLVEGDSLPLLCFTAYNDPSLSQAVALFNGLSTIRRLAPGATLILPKLG